MRSWQRRQQRVAELGKEGMTLLVQRGRTHLLGQHFKRFRCEINTKHFMSMSDLYVCSYSFVNDLQTEYYSTFTARRRGPLIFLHYNRLDFQIATSSCQHTFRPNLEWLPTPTLLWLLSHLRSTKQCHQDAVPPPCMESAYQQPC